MYTVTSVDLNKFKILLEEKNIPQIKEILKKMKAQDIAKLLEKIQKTDLGIIIFRLLDKKVAARTFAKLNPKTRKKYVEKIASSELNEVMKEMHMDNFVDLIEEMPANLVKKILINTPQNKREIVNQFLKYDKKTAGAIMTVEFLGLKADFTVKECLEKIKDEAYEKETINICYVLDSTRKLLGTVSLAELVLAEENEIVENIMDTRIISVTTAEQEEKVAKKMQKYNLIVLPVVDKEHRLVGIITVDDIMEIMKLEIGEDISLNQAVIQEKTPYFTTSVFSLSGHRLIWLILLMFSSMITGAILQKYELIFASIPLMVTFIPMITGTAGNCGAQSSTTIIRAMALGEISTKDFIKVLLKELGVGIIVGIILSIVNYIRIIVFGGNMQISMVVSIALLCTVILSKLIGGILPIMAKLIKIDPALMATPVIATIMDIVSINIYFGLAVQMMY